MVKHFAFLRVRINTADGDADYRDRGLWTIFALVKTHSKSDLNRRTICYCWTSCVSIGQFFFFYFFFSYTGSLRRVKITHFTTDFSIQMSTQTSAKYNLSLFRLAISIFVYYNILLSAEWPFVVQFRFYTTHI